MKYLIFYGSGIGDFFITLPVVQCIKKHDPNAYIKMFNRSDKNRIEINKDLMTLQNYIDEIDYYSLAEPVHSTVFFMKNGIKKYDYGIVVNYSDNDSLSDWPNRICNVACKKLIYLETRNKKVQADFIVKRTTEQQVYKHYLDCISSIGYPTVVDYKSLVNLEKLQKYNIGGDDNFTEIISLVIGAEDVSYSIKGSLVSNNSKKWPIDYWLEFAQSLKNAGYLVIILGGKKEKLEYSELFDKKESGIINLIGKTNILESISVLEQSSVVIGADTGLMHIAGALNKKMIGIYGCTDYKEYLPYGENCAYLSLNIDCSPCFGTEKSVRCTNKKCMQNITPQIVMNHFLRLFVHKCG